MPLLPVDRLCALLNAILVVAWLPWRAGVPWAAWYAAAHGAATLLPLLLVRLPARLHPLTALVREGYPLAWLALVWGELGVRHALLGVRHDALLAALETRLFGIHASAAWLPAMPDAWFSEAMHAVYASYYALLVAAPLLVLRRRSLPHVRELVLLLVAVYAGCFLVYAFFPSEGPLHTATPWADVHRGWWWRLTGAIRHAGDSLGTAFPSSHTAGAIVLAWSVRGHAPRSVAALFALTATAIALATVYTQNHLVLDVLAGVAVALVGCGVVAPWLARGGLALPAKGEARGERREARARS